MSEQVIVPDDRTQKQPVHCFCRNPACREKPTDPWFIFQAENDTPACPKCKADKIPIVGMLTLTHILIPDASGKVEGAEGTRWRIGCDSARAYLATTTNNEAATSIPSVVNCPGCIVAIEKLGIRKDSGKKLKHVPA
jgi:hypothetical protein